MLKKEFASIDYDTLNNDIQSLERQCNGIYVHEEDFHDLVDKEKLIEFEIEKISKEVNTEDTLLYIFSIHTINQELFDKL